MKIVIDAFGGDNAPKEIVLGAIDALNQYNDLMLTLVGDEVKINDILKENNFSSSKMDIIDAKDVITNDESPTMAIKRKKNSSLVVGLELLKNDSSYDAFVSAGSTGAVLAGSFMKLGRINGISRPALAPILPTSTDKKVILCDCGANIDCKPQQLHQFAIMGKAFSEAMLQIKNPTIALLSNGTEDKKGNELTIETFKLLKDDTNLNFVGNIEGRDIMSGEYDVVVADGFYGNIALKTAEGTATAIMDIMKGAVKSGGIRAILGALLFKPVLRKLKNTMDYNSQGGACFLGINKVVIKAHGSAKRESICACINQASELAKANVCKKISDGINFES